MSELGITFRTFTPLEDQTTKLGICSTCHKKSLREFHHCEHGIFLQCRKCLRVFVLEPQREMIG